MSERSLADEWEAQAEAWARWTRTPGHDHHNHRYNWPAFVSMVPAAGRATLDLGCGEGRGGVALRELGHHVVGLDSSGSLVAAFVHPFASAHLGRDAWEQLRYFDVQRTLDEVERDGLAFAFHQIHRPLAAWFGLFMGAGFELEDVREPCPTQADVAAVPRLAESRVKPAFLHVRWRR